MRQSTKKMSESLVMLDILYICGVALATDIEKVVFLTRH